MGRRFGEFVCDELISEGINKAHLPCQPLFDCRALPGGWVIFPFPNAIEISDGSFHNKPSHQVAHILMKQLAPGDDNADGDSAISVKPFEVLKVSVVEGVF